MDLKGNTMARCDSENGLITGFSEHYSELFEFIGGKVLA
jgi:hypothetical protein